MEVVRFEQQGRDGGGANREDSLFGTVKVGQELDFLPCSEANTKVQLLRTTGA